VNLYNARRLDHDRKPWDAQEILDRVTASGLRGRGGGLFPTGQKWRAVRVEGGEPVVVANGAEGEPGSIKDRFVMRTRTREVLEGLGLAARAVGAREAIVYLKGSFHAEARALEAGLRQWPIDGVSVEVRRGDDSYVAGEETAILEVLEGRRAWPRPKPPYPAAVGLNGRPTLVQNVETLLRVTEAVADPEAFRRTEKTYVSVWGHVRRPGVHEVALGTPLRTLIDEHAGGAPAGVGLVFPGGPSTAPLGPDALDTPFHPEALRAAGSAIGTAAVAVIRAPADPIAVAVLLARFFERESCGQCPPCTMGTQSLGRIARAVDGGTARSRDLADLPEIAGFMKSHGYCAHCRTAAVIVGGLLERHAGEAAKRVAKDAALPGDLFDPASPERAAIESVL
jgi:NADH-quinone oxidoreductase subunit F